jgi:hyperosmotically inducible protein
MAHKLLLLLCLAVIPAACASGSSSVRPMNTPTNAGAMDDATISARVKTTLLNDQQVNATKITVTTEGGVVSLSGTVRSKAEEARAIDLARQVTGVRDVKSSLTVAPIPQF